MLACSEPVWSVVPGWLISHPEISWLCTPAAGRVSLV
jgi:hypothetical protein